MAHFISPVRDNPFAAVPRVVTRGSMPKPASSNTAPADPPSFLNNLHSALGAPASASPAPAPTPAPAAAPSLWDSFRPPSAPATVGTPAAAPAPSGPPSLESVFGAAPWMLSPTGLAPDGTTYGYNPIFFATPQTAAKVAQMIGGTVVQSNCFTPNGGPFQQQQANWMVQLPDGRLVNPGLVASCYSHGYPQPLVDQMVATIVQNS